MAQIKKNIGLLSMITVHICIIKRLKIRTYCPINLRIYRGGLKTAIFFSIKRLFQYGFAIERTKRRLTRKNDIMSQTHFSEYASGNYYCTVDGL